MNDLISCMARDMKITSYANESQNSFTYRVLFSALGQWCLYMLKEGRGSRYGKTKHYQTEILNNLIRKYNEIYPETREQLTLEDSSLSLLIRHIYEETGYIFTDEFNRNHLNRTSRCVDFGNRKLSLNLAHNAEINGLGIYNDLSTDCISWREFIVRDNLTVNQYVNANFEIVSFDKAQNQLDDIQYFNPLSQLSPSQSWSTKAYTNYTIGRKSAIGPFYRIQNYDGEMFCCLERASDISETITAFEYRRMYFALKAYYNNPVKMRVHRVDSEYSRLRFSAHLPNREYYLLLLLSWPDKYAGNRIEFLTKNVFLEFITEVMMNLGIKVIGD